MHVSLGLLGVVVWDGVVSGNKIMGGHSMFGWVGEWVGGWITGEVDGWMVCWWNVQ